MSNALAVKDNDQKKKTGPSVPSGQPKVYTNALKQHIALSLEVFEQMFGTDWNTQRSAKEMTRMDFSGPDFMLETLEGPEGGLMCEHCKACRAFLRILNVSNNALTDINCLDKRKPGTTYPQFANLTVLIAARNQILNVSLSLESLMELNLAYNELELMPDTSGLLNLQKLILAHNKIKGSLKSLERNKKLNELIIHDNNFSWKPSEFRTQMEVLSANHLYKLTLWPNPFAENFQEYQFLAVTAIESLVMLDGFEIEYDLRRELQSLEEEMRAKNALDYSIFDIKVTERTGQLGMVKSGDHESVSRAQVPTLKELLKQLDYPLDHPDHLIKHVYEFANKINYLWNAHYIDRLDRMKPDSRHPEEAKLQVSEFSDKMQQLLGRFDSVQDVLVKCLVRLCASGRTHLSEACAILLAEWVDALPPELGEKLQSISTPLFRELRVRLLPGLHSFQDDPKGVFEATFPELMEQTPETKHNLETGFFGSKNAIAETAEILAALGKFGRAGFAQRPVANNRALVLRPLLPALCRHSRKKLGEEKPRDDCSAYEGFDVFFEAEKSKSTFQGPKDGFVGVCKSRAAKQNCGGFVVSAVKASSSLLQAQFIHETPDSIRGMREPCEGKILYVMPAVSKEAEVEEREEVEKMMTWDVWHNCLNVLCVATTDQHNAERCVVTYQIHKDLVRYEREVFNESLLNIANEASLAFTSLLHLARNLMNAPKTAGQEARNVFTNAKLHINCWERIRTRMSQTGTKQADKTMLLAALVRVVFEMSKGEQGAKVMKDISEGMEDVFNSMVDIAADTEAPDPLMLSASLETIWMFLNDERTRANVVTRVITKLHELAILLPYIKGPFIGDVSNNKYQDLWRMCEVKYGSDKHGPERMPQLFDGGKNAEWRSKVPDIKDMHNPLMHRVMLGVVRLIELVSDKADEPSGEFKRVNDMLNHCDRENMLIGPSNGLILVPDYDVKIEVLRVIMHVLENNPGQFSNQEMGWMLRYLQSKNLGYGRQEEFLIEVLRLTRLLVEDTGYTGFVFRQQFAKSAIRQAYEMLKVNSGRETAGRDSELQKVDLSLAIVEFLGTCSKPRTGGLRAFLRRVDFLETVKAVMKQEDKGAYGIREPLLRTWTGRSMREVLFPLVTMNDLDVKGLGRFRSLVRLADVLQGKMDYDTDGQPVKSTNEGHMWVGDNAMQRMLIEHDDILRKDTELQQQDFLSGGLDGVLSYGERLFYSSDLFSRSYASSITSVKEWALNAKTKVDEYWEKATGTAVKESRRAEEKQEETPKDQGTTNLNEMIQTRLNCINNRVNDRYGNNLSNFTDKNGDSLTKLAEVLEKEVKENMQIQTQSIDMDEWEELQGDEIDPELENQYNVGGKLYTMQQIKEDKSLKLEKCRQSTGNLKELMEQAHEAQRVLKENLLARGDDANPDSVKWASEKWTVGDQPEEMTAYVKDGLVEFLNKNEAVVFDPGIQDKDVVKRMSSYKYHDDLKRCRNIARLIIEVKDLATLIQLVRDIKKNTRFMLLLIRNRFKHPTALGSRYFQIFVEVVVGSTKHIAELKLVVAEGKPGGFKEREDKLRSNMDSAIRQFCQVAPEKVLAITEFLLYEMHSRSIRSGDVLYVQNPITEKFLSIDKQQVYMRTEDDENPMNQMNLFYIHRKDTKPGADDGKDLYGPVRTGDVIMLESYFTRFYIDISATNHGIRCRYSDPDCQQSNLKMVVESAPEKKDEALAGLSFFAASDDAAAEAATTKKKKGRHVHKGMDKNVHNQSSVMLKVYLSSSPQRRVSVKNVGALAALGSDRQALKAEPKADDAEADPQIFKFFREGNLDVYLAAQDFDSAENLAKCISGAKTEEQVQEFMLLQNYMAGQLTQQAPLEGGVFRRAPPKFEDIAQKQVTSKPYGKTEEVDDKSTELRGIDEDELQRRLAPMTVAGMFRCIYAMISTPALAEAKNKTLDEILGTIDAREKLTKLSRFMALAVTAVVAVDGKPGADSSALCYGHVTSKLLRTFSKCLILMPRLSMPCIEPTTEFVTESWRKQQQKKEDSGEYDRQRLAVLQIISDYMREVLVPAMLTRLAVAAQKPLTPGEVVLLKEMAFCAHQLARAFFANELRCKGDTPEALEDDDTGAGATSGGMGLSAIGGLGGGIGGIGDLTGGLTGGLAGGALALTGGEANEDPGASLADRMKTKGQILGEQEAAIFANLMPPDLVRVLVHAFLYGMRREMHAYTYNRNIGEMQESVKLISSMVQKSIHALASIMYGTDGLDYNVCEAISQAMCAGTMTVSRARTTQLMVDWWTERFRKAAQDKFDDGDWDEVADGTQNIPDSEPLQPKQTEKVMLVAFAYCGWPVPDGSSQMDFERKLVVLTTRLNLAIFTFTQPNDDGSLEPPDKDQLTFDSYRNLSYLKNVIVHPRMQQYFTLWWEKGKSGSPEGARHEVFIFECQSRRDQFRQALKGVCRFRERKKDKSGKEETFDTLETGPDRFVKEILPPLRFSLRLRKQCKDGNMQRSQAQLVNITFINMDPSIRNPESRVEVLMLTRDALVTISLIQFLNAYSVEVVGQEDKNPEPKLVKEDSDSDNDMVPPLQVFPITEMDDMTGVVPVHGAVWPIKDLQGVWFMAAEEPTMKLDFGGKVYEMRFFTDGCRQRFRQHLACTLKTGEEDLDADKREQQGKKWKVQPTRKDKMEEVKKELKTHERNLEAHVAQIEKMTQLALKH